MPLMTTTSEAGATGTDAAAAAAAASLKWLLVHCLYVFTLEMQRR